MIRLFGLVALLVTAPAALAFPDRPVTLVVPYAPGGPIDVVARVLAPELGSALGATVVIETRPGAGGNIGAQHVARSAPADAHSILFTGAALASSASLLNLAFDPVTELAPLAGVGAVPSLVVVSPASPHRDLASLLAAARARPGAVTFGSSGPGTGSHLAGVLLGVAAGVELTHVPYRGSAAVYPDLIAQRVDVLLELMSAAYGQVTGGAVRALAITSATRSEALPEIPTVAEAGLPGYAFATWTGMFIRAGAPEPARRRLEAAVLTALRAAPVQERLRLSATQPIPTDAEGFAAYFRADVARWATMVREGRLQKLD